MFFGFFLEKGVFSLMDLNYGFVISLDMYGYDRSVGEDLLGVYFYEGFKNLIIEK